MRREVREGACIGAATMIQPWTLRLILNAAALADESRLFSSGAAVKCVPVGACFVCLLLQDLL